MGNDEDDRNRASNIEYTDCGPDEYKIVGGCGCLVVVLIVAIVLLAKSLNRLESTEYGVQHNVRRKELKEEEVFTGGIHFGPPGYEFVKFPSTFITSDLPMGTCVSQDGLRVQFSVTYQFLMPQEWLYPAILKYRNYGRWTDVVESAATSAVQHTCSEFNISNFQNQRGIIQSTMEERLRTKLEGSSSTSNSTTVEADNDNEEHDGVYARAVSLQLRNVELPEEYNQAVAEKQEANEDIALAINQRKQETTKANTALQAAQQEAQRILDTARNEADVLLTEARLKAEETTFSFEREAEVLVNVKYNLNLTTEGLLTYLANDLYSKVPALKVASLEPALLSRSDEL